MCCNNIRYALPHLQVVSGNPGVVWKFLEVGHQELHTAIPVRNEEHKEDEVEDSQHRPSGFDELEWGTHRKKVEKRVEDSFISSSVCPTHNSQRQCTLSQVSLTVNADTTAYLLPPIL